MPDPDYHPEPEPEGLLPHSLGQRPRKKNIRPRCFGRSQVKGEVPFPPKPGQVTRLVEGVQPSGSFSDLLPRAVPQEDWYTTIFGTVGIYSLA